MKRTNQLGEPTLLVVDDDTHVRNIMEETLTTWGYTVETACNGQEGLQVIHAHHMDGIFLDVNMPVMNGRTMLDRLRWLEFRGPVIMMSGGLDQKELGGFLQEGAEGVLTKPFSLPSLKRVCEHLFSRARVPTSP